MKKIIIGVLVFALVIGGVCFLFRGENNEDTSETVKSEITADDIIKENIAKKEEAKKAKRDAKENQAERNAEAKKLKEDLKLKKIIIDENGKLIKYNGIEETVKVPSAVKSIGNKAFADPNSDSNNTMKNVILPKELKEIDEYAFYRCMSLESLSIPSGVTKIGDYAFCGCMNLRNITIPKSVTKIGEYAFAGCRSLTGTHNLKGVVKRGTFSGCENIVSVNLKEVTEIEHSAFYNCPHLKTVIIPYNVTNIGEYAFAGCTGMETVDISSKKIGKNAFLECRALKNVTLSDTVTNIRDYAFVGCSSLTSVHIPESVKEIGTGAFDKCGEDLVFITKNKTAAEYAKKYCIKVKSE